VTVDTVRECQDGADDDNPEKTTQLLAALKGAVPFKVDLVPSLVNYLRAQHIAGGEQTEPMLD